MSRHAVDEQLRIARAEARLFLDDPDRLQFLSGVEFETTPMRPQPRNALKTSDILIDLRDLIFRTSRGECLSTAELQEIYEKDNGQMREASTSAHVVSCAVCLEKVNKILGLPALEDRYPTDVLEPEKTDRSDKGGPSLPKGGGGSGGGTTSSSAIKRHRREMKKVREHRPLELRIAVNGFILGSQRVGLEVNEQTLSIKGEEKIGFIEVLSEQGVRLLFLNVDAPPDGGVEHRASVGLSEGRELELSLNFSGPWPTVNVVYSDPTAAPLPSAIIETTPRHSEESQISKVKIDKQNSESTAHSLPEKTRISARASAWIARLVRYGENLVVWRPDLRRFVLPGAIAAVALIGLAVLLVVTLRSSGPPVKLSAGDLLARSAAADALTGSGHVVHRSIAFEAREFRKLDRPTGQVGTSASDHVLIARRRIDIWQSAEKGVSARRVYDERNQLIAGQWATSEGKQTIYHHEQKPRHEAESDRSIESLLAKEGVWRLDVSAEEFSALIAGNVQPHVEERWNAYVISYEAAGATTETASSASSTDGATLIGATLSLSKADLHATELILLVEKGEDSQSDNRQWFEYSFTEISFERHAASSVAPGVFEPEQELTGNPTETITSSIRLPVIPPPTTPPVPVATAALELQVLALLNRIGADLGQEVVVTRIPGEVLRLEAVVDTEQRKREIMNALAPVADNLAVQMQIETSDEAQQRTAKQPAVTSTGIITTETVTANSIAVHAEVRRYLLARGLPEHQVETEVGRVANQVLMRSHRAMLHVWALKSLVGRFSVEELETLDTEARAKWLGMVRAHAHEFQREAQGLRRELASIFNVPEGGGSQGQGERADDALLGQTINLLISRASANHEVVRSAFTVSSGANSFSAITTPQFWQSLDLASQLASQIQNAAFIQ